MLYKALPGLNDLRAMFLRRLIEIALCVLLIVVFSGRRLYQFNDHQLNLYFWLCMLVLFCLGMVLAGVYFWPDFALFNNTVTQFSIHGECLTIRTMDIKRLPVIGKPSAEIKFKMHEFSRDKAIYPTRVFPKTKYLVWELRDGQNTVYILERFFNDEAIAELEKFLYWPGIKP